MVFRRVARNALCDERHAIAYYTNLSFDFDFKVGPDLRADRVWAGPRQRRISRMIQRAKEQEYSAVERGRGAGTQARSEIEPYLKRLLFL